MVFTLSVYCNDPKSLDKQVFANPDQTGPKDKSDQGLHCLPFPLHYLDTLIYGKSKLFSF